MNRRLYAIHRWLSAIAFIQLALWTASGTFFTLFDIADVRGRSVENAHQATLPAHPIALSVPTALQFAAQYGFEAPEKLELRAYPQGMFYLVRQGERSVRMDAGSGARAPVEELEAEEIARRDQPGRPSVVSKQLVTVADVAYRGKPVPAWRVRMADRAETDVFVDATTGEVTARRNKLWRTYDFLWSLHIMDYRERESFHHPLMMGACALALLTVISGAVHWAVRIGRRLRTRRGPAQA